MRVFKDVKVKFMDKEASCKALFDPDVNATLLQHSLFKGSFGAKWLAPPRPLRLKWLNSEAITIDKYAHVDIIVDYFEMPETVFIIDGLVGDGCPELVIGLSTTCKYGVVLGPEEGVRLTRAVLML